MAALVCPLVVAGCHPPPPRPGDGGPVLLWTDPADGAIDVSRTRPFRIVFDRPLSPRAITPESVLLRSGDRSLGLRITMDPAAHALDLRPVSRLDPEIEYRIEVAALEDLDGAASDAFVVHFATGLDQTEYPERAAAWTDVADIFAGRCGYCHGADRPPAGMDLSSALGVRTTALGVPARGARASGEVGPAVAGLLGLARIEPGRPERSYLVYKLLGDPHILGARMPYGQAPLDPEDIATIVSWIQAGAPVD